MKQQAVIIAIDKIKVGNIVSINSPVGILNFEYKNKPQTDEPNEEKYLRLGFKIEVIHKQLETLDKLQRELTTLEMAFENKKPIAYCNRLFGY